MTRRDKAALAVLIAALPWLGACRSDSPGAAVELRQRFPAQAEGILSQAPTRFAAVAGGFQPEVFPADAHGRFGLELPAAPVDPVVLSLPGFRATVSETGLKGPGLAAGKAISYERQGGYSIWAVTTRGYEEWLLLEGGPAREVRWTIAGARLANAGKSVLLVDAAGSARLAVSAPQAFASGGAPLEVRLFAKGQELVLEVPASRGPLLIDPLWELAGASLADARHFHTATVVGERVLLAGGAQDPAGTQLASAEVFDPDAGTFSATGPLAEARQWHSASSLSEGAVLVAGGYSSANGAIGTTEIWSADAGNWTAGEPLGAPRYQHTATTLLSGVVLVAGGRDDAGVLGLTELFDPDAGTWVPAGSLSAPRHQHSATRLQDGRVLVAGGLSAAGVELSSAELFDPDAGSWSAAAAMGHARAGHTATALDDGGVLVAGGIADGGTQAERYDLAADSWSPAGAVPFSPTGHAATLLGNGKVLVCAGAGNQGAAAVYDPGANAFSSAGCPSAPRAFHTATRLPASGAVLVAGGSAANLSLASAEFFDPAGGKAPGAQCSSACECASGFCTDGVCCDSACNAGSCDACSVAAGAPLDGTCFFLPATEVCRPVNGGCDVAESCTGTSGECPVDALSVPGTICRASNGACDLEEQCTGAAAACPADGFAAGGVACRPAAGACDVEEQCTGTGADCPTDALALAGATCRAAAGSCDVAELCSGTTSDCPTDALVGSGNVCRPSAGDCDVAEECTGAAADCPSDALVGPGNICRPASGTCDLAEQCTGTAATCPTDALVTSGAICRVAAGSCDLPEQCDGTAADCPTDALVGPGTVCRPAAGACDVEEQCTGAAAVCPTDALADPSVVCRAAAGTCDLAEQCTGASATCPSDGLAGAGSVCRPAAGACDVEEQCAGDVADCPSDALAASSVVCRAAAGSCDLAEQCTGLGVACPSDALVAPGNTCRPAAGECDLEEQCTGAAADCPTDALAGSSVVCRAAAGTCDLAEHCTGAAAVCPTDAVAASTVTCRAAADSCDLPEQCTGAAATCPADLLAPQGSAGSPVCTGYLCSGSATACPNTCAADGDCVSGFYCSSNTCTPKKANGATCQAGNECASGPCVDGYCCDGSCGGACEACNVAGSQGSCTPVALGTPGRISCAPYLCNGTASTCPASCTSTTQCTSPLVCLGGACVDAPVDAGTDAGPDAGSDGGPDAGADAGRDAGSDAGSDAGTDAGTDAGADAGRDAGADAGPTADAGRVRDAGGTEPDAGSPPEHFVGWGCTSTGPGAAPGMAILLAGLALLRRRTRKLAGAAALTLVATSAVASAQGSQTPTLRLSAMALRDVEVSQVAAELGGSYGLSEYVDIGALASLGRYTGGRLTVALHPAEDWSLRPFLQLRGVYHPVPSGVALGVGAQLGAQYQLGPGRVSAGILGEVYDRPEQFAPYGLFALAGYEFDLLKPEPAERRIVVEPTPVAPLKSEPVVVVPVPSNPPPTPAKPPPEDPGEDDELGALIAPPPLELAPLPVPATGETRVITRIHIRDVITFAPKDARVRPRFNAVLKKVSELLKRTPQIKSLRVSGHADDYPTEPPDEKLSLQRAQAVVKVLTRMGVDPARLVPAGFGRTRLVAPQDAKGAAREQNRRVDFLIVDPAEMEPDAFREQ